MGLRKKEPRVISRGFLPSGASPAPLPSSLPVHDFSYFTEKLELEELASLLPQTYHQTCWLGCTRSGDAKEGTGPGPLLPSGHPGDPQLVEAGLQPRPAASHASSLCVWLHVASPLPCVCPDLPG